MKKRECNRELKLEVGFAWSRKNSLSLNLTERLETVEQTSKKQNCSKERFRDPCSLNLKTSPTGYVSFPPIQVYGSSFQESLSYCFAPGIVALSQVFRRHLLAYRRLKFKPQQYGKRGTLRPCLA